MSNLETLRRYSDLSEEEKKEFHRKGAFASHKERRKKRTFREIIELLGNETVLDENIKEKLQKLGFKADEITQDIAAVQTMYDEVILKGNTSAFNTLRDTKGEKPIDRQEHSIPEKIEIGFVKTGINPVNKEEDIQ